MFDIGWSELLVIAAVALVLAPALEPCALPGCEMSQLGRRRVLAALVARQNASEQPLEARFVVTCLSFGKLALFFRAGFG